MIEMRFEGLTDVGRKRDNNEDNFGIDKKNNIIVVCDGMGGHLAGEVASEIAVKTILDLYGRSIREYMDLIEGIDDKLPLSVRKLGAAIRAANRMIYNEAIYNPNKKGMGTTAVAGVFFESSVGIAHTGDSRAYLWRDGKLSKITKDHSYVQELVEDNEITEEEAENFSQKNVITRALGTKYSVKIDINIRHIQEGDIYLLCTDGLTGELRDNEIEEIITRFYPDTRIIAEKLIEFANNAGGRDNVTVGIAYVKKTEGYKKEQKELFAEIPEETEEFLEKEDEILKKLYKIKKPPWFKTPVGKYSGIGLLVIIGILGFLVHKRTSVPRIDSVWIKLTTSPDSCEVKWNGKNAGIAPLIIPDLKPCSTYTYVLKHYGYKILGDTIRIPAPESLQGETIPISRTLQPEATLTLGYDDEKYNDYELFLDGKNMGNLSKFKGKDSQEKDFPISKGNHRLEIKSDIGGKFKEWKGTVPEDGRLIVDINNGVVSIFVPGGE